MRGWENPFRCKTGIELGICVATIMRIRDGC
jgi:hypothetical protein